jgi:hypothetical protein
MTTADTRVEIIENPENGHKQIVRYPTVKCERHKDRPYTFENVASIDKKKALRINGVWVIYDHDYYDRTTMPVGELLALCRQAEQAIAAADRAAIAAGATPSHKAVMPVPIAALTLPTPGILDDGNMDWARQVRVSLPHVADITTHYDPQLAQLPEVSFRFGVDEHGETYVYVRTLDGTHRTTSAIERGETVIMAHVQILHSPTEEALAYKTANSDRKVTAAMDQIRARFAANDPTIHTVFEIGAEYGFELLLTNKNTPAWPKIGATRAVEKIYTSYGEAVLRRVFEIVSSGGPLWQCSEALESDMLLGLALFVTKFEVPGYVHHTMLHNAMCQSGAKLIKNMAATGKSDVKNYSIDDVRQKLRIESNAKSLSGESTRWYSVALALYDAYARTVKSAAKNKEPGHTLFTKLWELWANPKLASQPAAHKRPLIERCQIKLRQLAVPKIVNGMHATDVNGNMLFVDTAPKFSLPPVNDSRYVYRPLATLAR